MVNEVLEILTDFLDAVEAGAVNAKRQIAHMPRATPLEKAPDHDASAKASPKLPFDADKIKWQDRENEKGKFQCSEDYDSLDHKALLAFLNEHVPSKCVRSGSYFYWIYPNGTTIGRKLQKK
jgi:hypothetical protein